MHKLLYKAGTGLAAAAIIAQGFAGVALASLDVEISGNGANSDNTANVAVSTDTQVTQNNTANITNNVNVSADTGANDANKNTGGDLGWFYKGRMVAPFEEAAYSLAIGEISQPVQTENGWHIIQVIGHENRSLTASELDSFKNAQFTKWLETQRSMDGVKMLENWLEDLPTTPTIPPDVLVQS